MSETSLTVTEQSDFSGLEQRIASGLESFVSVGQALSEIRERKLYRQASATFEEYCQTRWQFTKRRANQIIEASQVAISVASDDAKCEDGSPLGTIVPKSEPIVSNEGQARELAKVPATKRRQVMERAAASATKDKAGKPKITAQVVRRAAEEEMIGESEPPKDEAGQPITDPALVGVFAERERFDRILSLLKQVAREVNPLLGNADDQRPIAGGEWIAQSRQQFLVDLKNVRNAVTFARPYALCPYPHAKGQTCPACKGLGWVVERTYAAAPGEYKRATKGAA